MGLGLRVAQVVGREVSNPAAMCCKALMHAAL